MVALTLQTSICIPRAALGQSSSHPSDQLGILEASQAGHTEKTAQPSLCSGSPVGGHASCRHLNQSWKPRNWKDKYMTKWKGQKLKFTYIILTLASFYFHSKYCFATPLTPNSNQRSNLVFPGHQAVGNKITSFTWTCDETWNCRIRLRTQKNSSVYFPFSISS